MSGNGKNGRVLYVMGGLLLIAALALAAFNLWDDNRSGQESASVLAQILPQTTEAAVATGEYIPAEESAVPDYVLNPDMEMPEKKYADTAYIAVLRIPALGLELPVIGALDDTALRIAPCRYAGSVYTDDLVIAGHNYTSHFGRLRNLEYGDEVILTDMDGNVFDYAVVDVETLAPTDIGDMLNGDWDLTLFTCTLSGQARVTVRCCRIGG